MVVYIIFNDAMNRHFMKSHNMDKKSPIFKGGSDGKDNIMGLN